MAKHADQQKRFFAIMALEAGYSKSEIRSFTNMSRQALDRLFRKSAEFSSGKSSADPTLRKPGSGRPKEMTDELRLQIRKVMEEEDEDEMKVSAWYIREKLPSLNGICLRSIQQVVTDIRREKNNQPQKDNNNIGD